MNCNLFKNLKLGIDPKLFTHRQINDYFLKYNKVKLLSNNLIDEIKTQKTYTNKIIEQNKLIYDKLLSIAKNQKVLLKSCHNDML